MLKNVIHYFNEEIWSIPQRDLSRGKGLMLRSAKVLILAVRGFAEDKCRLHASALSLFTLLSIVPVFAMAFGIAKGFGFEEMLEAQIMQQLPEQEAVLQQVVGFAKTMLENTKGGVVAGIGIAVLFWSVIKVIGYIEESFNHIWRVKQSRPLARKFSDYLSLMLIGPILMLVSGSATVFVKTQLDRLGEEQAIPLSETISSAALFLLGLVPMGSLWVLFSFLYVFLPNTRVNIKACIVAGIITGTLYYLVQWIYVSLQVGVANYNAIYGSFAALPLFLVWLQLSWFIVLFGAELAYYLHILSTYEYHPGALDASHRLRTIGALLVMHRVMRRFCAGERPMTGSEIATRLGLPIQLTERLLEVLTESGLLAAVQTDDDRAPAFQPARDPDSITVAAVMEALEQRGCNRLPVVSAKEFDLFDETLRAFAGQIADSPQNRLLKEI